MNRKQLAILLVLVLALGGAAWFLRKNRESSWAKSPEGAGKKLFVEFPYNEVSHIVIRQGTNELNLTRKSDLWRVNERNEYLADFSEIKKFLVKVRDLKAVQTDQVGPSQLPRLQLAATGQGTNAPTIVEFKGQDARIIQSLYLGKMLLKKADGPSPFGEGADEGWPAGRYVRTGADAGSVALISDPLDGIEPRPDRWLDKDFLKVERARSVEVAFPTGTNSWKLSRETETGPWKLADAKPGEELDASKTAAISNPLSSPSFTDVLPGGLPDASGTSGPTVVKIETFDQFAYTINVGRKTNDDYLISVAVAAQIQKERTAVPDEKPEDKTKLDQEFKEKRQKLEDKLKQETGFAPWTYLVSGWTVETLLKERHQLLAGKKEEPKATGNPTNNPASGP